MGRFSSSIYKGRNNVKFQLTFKTPDVIDQLDMTDGEEKESLKTFLNSWVQYGELIKIEFDSVRRTARVIPNL